MRSHRTRSQRSRRATSRLPEGQHARDGGGDALPVRGFLVQVFLAGTRQRIALCTTIVLTRAPLTLDPAFLFQLVERGVERPVADLKNIAGYLKQPLPDRPTVQWLEGENLENQQIQSPLEEIGRLAHSCSYLGYRVRLPPPPL